MPVNAKLVHVFRLLEPVEGRPEEGAWVFAYHGEHFITDVGGANPEPFAWHEPAHEPVAGFEVKTQEELAGALHVNPALLTFIQRGDPSFPAPILSFRDGPIWDAQAVERWLPTRQALDARDRSLPRS